MNARTLTITTTLAPSKSAPALFLAADVSRATLNLFTRFERAGNLLTIEDQIPNYTRPIEEALTQISSLALEHGAPSLCVVCEASGGYEKLLLATAQRMGLATALVSGEQAQVLTKLESLDTAKTDKKDARLIHLAATSGKLQRHRRLPERYQLLRRLTAFHDDEVRLASALRTRILQVLGELFPDYDRQTQFTFSGTGRTLLREGLLDPGRLMRLGQSRLLQMLRRRVKGVKTATADHLLRAAEASARRALPGALAAVLSRRLAVLLAELEQHEAHAGELREQIERIGDELKARGELPAIDEAVSGLTLFNLARLIGQTGPLSDFGSKRQLLRYAGMNLRERQSGTYRGQTRLSKKGRPLLRKVLGQAIFPLLRRDRLLGARYAERRERMPERKAKVAAMRKLLVLVYGAQRSNARGERFDKARVYCCQSQYAA